MYLAGWYVVVIRRGDQIRLTIVISECILSPNEASGHQPRNGYSSATSERGTNPVRGVA